MGYPADLARARDYYRRLARRGEPTPYEQALRLDAAGYRARIAELESWERGLERGEPAAMRAMAERYLGSQMPGPGVRERGVELLERLAAAGDIEARDQLILALRTGHTGAARDVPAARAWLIRAAEAGDAAAMERVADNSLNGHEGFPVDYPEARRWLRALIEHHAGGDAAAQAEVRRHEQALRHIDRLEQEAGGPLLGERELVELGRGTDAESHCRYARQLLAGHGRERRAEAIERLREAARQGHGDAAWRLFQIHERGYPEEIDPDEALAYLELAVANHHFDATRELALSYEQGQRGLPVDLPRAIALYESALAAGRDNRYGWNLDPGNYNHFKWVESRLRQARMKADARATSARP
jgi:TPR repeat protein